MWRRPILPAMLILFGISCAPGIRDVWSGSGEFGEARFYTLDLNLSEKKPFAVMKWYDGTELLLAVCALDEDDGRVRFKMDIDARAASCDRLVEPVQFVGEMGRDVVTGTVQDASGRLLGPFRALRYKR